MCVCGGCPDPETKILKNEAQTNISFNLSSFLHNSLMSVDNAEIIGDVSSNKEKSEHTPLPYLVSVVLSS